MSAAQSRPYTFCRATKHIYLIEDKKDFAKLTGSVGLLRQSVNPAPLRCAAMKMPGPRSRTKSSVDCSRSSHRGMAIVCRRSLRLLMFGAALITVLPTAAFAQNLLIDALSPASNTPNAAEAAPPEVPPIQAIEAALAEARRKLAALEHHRCRTSPTPTAIFSDSGDSPLLFEVRFWIRYDEQTDRAGIQSDVRYRIDELFAEAGIAIAFPQLDVHVDVSDRERGNS